MTDSGTSRRVWDNVVSSALQESNYNVRGMLEQRTDMDMGTWVFKPNALGEVINIRDAKTSAPNWTQTITFDLLGRMTDRSEAEGTSTWTWGTSSAAKNIGRLSEVVRSRVLRDVFV